MFPIKKIVYQSLYIKLIEIGFEVNNFHFLVYRVDYIYCFQCVYESNPTDPTPQHTEP